MDVGDLVGDLATKIGALLFRKRVGRWILTVVLLFLGSSFLLTFPGQSQQLAQEYLIFGAIFTLGGLVLLFYVLMLGLFARVSKAEEASAQGSRFGRILRRIGRWTVTTAFLLLGALLLLTFSDRPHDQAVQFVALGIFFALLGLVLLVYAVVAGRYERRSKKALARVQELIASGQLLFIPALPLPRNDISAGEVAEVEEYTRRMVSVPWGEVEQMPAEQVRPAFDQAVARVRRVRGDLRELAEPIDLFVRMPKPLCFVGAAEVMCRLSYLRWRTNVPEGLREGLRFIRSAQYYEPRQPDALIIRLKLLAGCAARRWIELADQTLALLRQVAPDHPRLPDAEAAVHIQQGDYDAALACLERALGSPPSPQEAYVALSNRALLLQQLERYDEALAAYEQTLALDPADPWAWHNKSLVLFDLGRYDEALACNDRALAIAEIGVARGMRRRIVEKQAEVQGGVQPNGGAAATV